jgi:hypothetical protein
MKISLDSGFLTGVENAHHRTVSAAANPAEPAVEAKVHDGCK